MIETNPMKISMILAHPRQGSFNHAIAAKVSAVLEESGHAVSLHDLYAEGFDPILTDAEIPATGRLPPQIDAHCREIAQAEGIVVIHPNWWGQPPAILKGWVDRVLRTEVAYHFREGDSGEGVPEGLLKASCALVFNTTNTEEGSRTRSLRRSAGNSMEELHSPLLRCGSRRAPQLRRCRHQHSRSSAQPGWKMRPAWFGASFPSEDAAASRSVTRTST